MGLPEITVTFKKLAETASRRSAGGYLCVLLRDTTSGVTWSVKEYKWLEEVKASDFSAANYKILARAFTAGPTKVIVVRLGASGTVEDAAPLLRSVAFNWICAPYANMQEDLADYVKEVNTSRRVRKAKALVYQVEADDIHVVSACNPTVTIAGEAAATPMVEYLPRLAGILAACPMDRSVTNYALEDLAAVADYTVSGSVVEPGDAVDLGQMALYLDDDTIRIARGVTTLQTITGDLTEDMTKIAVVEAMDIIQEDIVRTFKNFYQSKCRNSADHQALFVGDVLGYLRQLETEGILEADYSKADIDVDAMRTAWEAEGQSMADQDDGYVRKKTYKSYVFVTATIRIQDAMEDLRMVINLG